MKQLSTLLTVGIAVLTVQITTHAANKPDPMAAAKQIDALLSKDWAANNLKANPPANDEIMVRRLYLDIAGRIPTARESEDYLHSKDPKKREKLIDQLLGGEGYVQNFFNYWADVLRLKSRDGNFGFAYAQFIKDALRTNKPYDQFVRQMVAANGDVWNNGAVGYYMRDRGMPLDNMATTVRIFLGTRIECAQCHNHPFDHWTQKQFYQMAAFTYGVNSYNNDSSSLPAARKMMNEQEQELRKKMKGNTDPALKEEFEKTQKENRYRGQALGQAFNGLQSVSVGYQDRKLQLPQDYKYPDEKPKAVVAPAVMMGKPIDCPPGAATNTMESYAQWMTAGDNPRFTRVIVNRLWKKAFGLALTEPLDELMDNSEAMVPELQKYLESYMISSGYDMKGMLKALYNTKAYQAQVTREEVPAGIVYHFTGPLLRRMTAEQMWDSLVALINPSPDMANAYTIEQDQNRLMGVKKLHDSLESLSPEELIKGADVAGKKILAQSDGLKALQAQINEARAAEDKEKVKELSRQANQLQNLTNRAVAENITMPAALKLAADVRAKSHADGKDAIADASSKTEDGTLAANSNMSMMMMSGDPYRMLSEIKIPGYDSMKTEKETQAEREAQEKAYYSDAAYYGIPEKQQKGYVQYRQQQARTWLRASEIESPAPRGHYLREFGQSDRETVENGNRDASVPQALSMMNGSLLPEILAPYSQLSLSVGRAQYPDDQVNAIYMTLLSRKPTDHEKQMWLEAQDKGLSDVKDLIYAILNTQQFIFVQ